MTKNYPEQVGPYIIKTKAEQSTHHWKDFNTVRLPISVGQEYHEGEKMAALAQWCEHRFDHVIFCVGDTLQRFNMMFEQDMGEDEAFMKTKSEGTSWIERNIPRFSHIKSLEIKRWDFWRKDPKYPGILDQVHVFYQENTQFYESIEKNIGHLWQRRQKAIPNQYTPSRFEYFTELSRRYLLEEIAVFCLMYEEEIAIDVYPGSVIFSAVLFQGKTVPNCPSGLGKGHFCRIDFSRKEKVSAFNAKGE
jgi:tRNA-dependent cyclodipeptide synthase